MKTNRLIVLVEPELKDVLLFEWAMKELKVQNPVRVMQKTSELRAYLDGQGAYANRELFPLPVLITLDLDLPGMDAARFLHWLRNKSSCPAIPVIGTSAFEVSRRVQAFFDLGLNAFYRKRLNIQETLACLREMELLQDLLNREPAATTEQLKAAKMQTGEFSFVTAGSGAGPRSGWEARG